MTEEGTLYAALKSHKLHFFQAFLLELFESVIITTKVVGKNPAHTEVYSIQCYVVTFVSDLLQVDGYLRCPPPIKLTARL